MARIEHISDQLEAYSEEVAWIIKAIQKKYDLEYNQAATAVGIATLDMLADVMHHMEDSIRSIPDNIGYVSSSIEEGLDSIAPSAWKKHFPTGIPLVGGKGM